MYLFSLFNYYTFVFGSKYILIWGARPHLTRGGYYIGLYPNCNNFQGLD